MSVADSNPNNEPAPAPAPSDPNPAPAPQPAPAPAPEPAPQPTPAPQPAPQPTPEPPKAEVSWSDLIAKLPDEKLRNVGSRFTSLEDALKSNIDLRTDNSQRIKVPGEGASEEDIAKFRKVLGVPDKVDGYKITPPEGITLSDADNAVMEAVLPLGIEHGVPAAAMQSFAAAYIKLSHDIEQATLANIQKAHDTTVAALKAEWKGDYDGNVNVANRAGEVLGGEGFKAFLNNTVLPTGGKLGDHPEMARFLAKIGKRMDEGDLMLGQTPEQRTSIQAEIDALDRAVPPGSAGYTDPAHQAKRAALFERLHGNGSIVGANMRAA